MPWVVGGWPNGGVLHTTAGGSIIYGMPRNPHHPFISADDSRAWDRDKVIAYLLPVLDTMSLPEALAAGYIDEKGKRHGLPTMSTISRWVDEVPQFAAAITRARKNRAAYLVEEALQLVDKPPPRNNKGEIDRGHVRHAESRANMRKWVAERLDPEQFGQRVGLDVHHHGAIDLKQVLAEAAHRVIEGQAERIEPGLPVIDDASDLFD